jgi:cyanophycin synthetase
VLNADDPAVAALAPRCPGRVILYSADPANPVVIVHRAKGRRAVMANGGHVLLAEGNNATTLASLANLPSAPGRVETTLACVAACWALEMSLDAIHSALK